MHSKGVMVVALLLYDTTVYLLIALACAKGRTNQDENIPEQPLF